MNSYTEIDKCRVCGNRYLMPIINLGDQYLGGVFPKEKDHLNSLTRGPLELVKCRDDLVDPACGLLQLRQSYDPDVMFTNNKYGYLSGLNQTMVEHLRRKQAHITRTVTLNSGDYVVDIGSNDSTLLQAYPQPYLNLIGVDPGGEKFRKYYPNYIQLISDFFSADALRDAMGGQKAKVITSIAMLYDLEDPMHFMREVHDILADDGIWVTEQSYMPEMLDNRAYDTICHEHLEYYGLKQIKWMADRAGFRILDVEINKVNGGSLSVTLVKGDALYPPRADAVVNQIIADEERLALEPYAAFTYGVGRSKRELCKFLGNAKSAGKLVCGLGASTKGNTILQYCGITDDVLPFIGEVNSDKFGCFTPGTQIPIVPEEEVLAMKPDFLLVLPWHFRSFFLDNPKYAGSGLVFPLPALDVYR